MPSSMMEEVAMAGPSPSPCRLDRCAGCNAAEVSLLACDDLDGKGGILVPSNRSRFCANCMIGKKVRVFWPVDNSWYIGTVQQYDASTGEHLLRYEDDDTEWVKIGESNTTVPQTTTIPLAHPATGHPSIGLHGRTASPHEGSLLESLPPPVSPASHMIDNAESPRHHPYSLDTTHSATTVSPDEKWHQHLDTSRIPGGSQPYSRSYGSAGGAYPPHSIHHHHPGGGPPPPYGGFHPSQGPPPGYGFSSRMGMHGSPGPHGSIPPHLASESLLGKFLGRHDNASSPSPGSASAKRKSGPKAWTKEEDALLLNIVQSMRMPMKWSLVAQNLPERTGKQCRERYVNHLNPRLKVTDWSPIEDATIFHLYNTIGSHWAKMSKIIPGRTDNGIKNRFHNLRRQLEREDEHRLRLNAARDYPEEIRLDLLREFPQELRGKTADLWDIKSGLSVLAAQSVLGGGMSRTAGRFGPFREAQPGDICVRCGLLVPSVQTGKEICTKTGWCQSCARIPPHVSGNMLRECLTLRRCQDSGSRTLIESWQFPNDGTSFLNIHLKGSTPKGSNKESAE